MNFFRWWLRGDISVTFMYKKKKNLKRRVTVQLWDMTIKLQIQTNFVFSVQELWLTVIATKLSTSLLCLILKQYILGLRIASGLYNYQYHFHVYDIQFSENINLNLSIVFLLLYFYLFILVIFPLSLSFMCHMSFFPLLSHQSSVHHTQNMPS